MKEEPVDTIRRLRNTLDYHERSKHHPHHLAASLGYLDWDSQPDPFRRFEGAPEFPLELHPVDLLGGDEKTCGPGSIDPVGIDSASVARLFQDSLGLSAWKEAAGSRWALRVNPSSGNLHPTEGYLVARTLRGVSEGPAVYHYSARDHLLELRTELSDTVSRTIFDQLPLRAMLVGLTSIYWREAWKYGERAFRYCQHDVGHAIACVSIAAAGLGWKTRVLDGVTDAALAALLGVHSQRGVEAEHPHGLMAIVPPEGPTTVLAAGGPSPDRDFDLDDDVVDALENAEWMGTPNSLSADHHEWPAIDHVAAATRKVASDKGLWPAASRHERPLSPEYSSLSLRGLIHQRRSAVALDRRTGITKDVFFRILARATPNEIPFTSLWWPPCIDLLLFVHRVKGLESGLYVHVRDPERKTRLQAAMLPGFRWIRSAECPDNLDVYLLEDGDSRHVAQQASCGQAIAADGAFAVAMIADYGRTLEEYGPWFYRRLFWETGVIGQVLYLQAEASGIRGTGIGCYFDDLTHRLFGIADDGFQVLYHFTMGGAVDDPRLQTHPPYAHLEGRRIGSQ